MNSRPDIAGAQSIIGHEFNDAALLRCALTHTSAIGSSAAGNSFERLEFLGDRVLGLAISANLIAVYPDDPEGQLSRRLSALVRKETCADVMRESGLSRFLALTGNERTNTTIQGDACEALIGAIFLDGGFDAAQAFVARYWGEKLRNPPKVLRDPKSRLQEWSLGRGLGVPVYAVIERTGPDHAPHFRIEARIEGHEPTTGEGGSKRDAEMMAAQIFLDEAAGKNG